MTTMPSTRTPPNPDADASGFVSDPVFEALLTLADPHTDGTLYEGGGAAIYDALVAHDSGERTEILRAIRATTGPILELACGSGRLALALLSLGRPVTALDLSADMLALLTERHAALPARARSAALSVVHADMSAVTLPERFGAIILATTSLTLLPAEKRPEMYRRIRAHLAPAGRFFVSVHAVRPRPASATVAVPGAGAGQMLLISDVVRTGAESRDVQVMSLTRAAGGIRLGGIFRSRPLLLDVDGISAELRAAGFRTVRPVTTIAATAGDRTTVLLEATP